MNPRASVGETSDKPRRGQSLRSVQADLAVERQRLADAVVQRRDAEDLAQAIIHSALDAVVAIDESGAIVEWNPRAEEIFGWQRSEVLGRDIADIVIPEASRAAHHEGLQRFLATGEGPVLERRLQLTAIRKSGEEFPVELTISPTRFGTGWRFSAFIRDRTEQKGAEDALRESEERFRSMFQLAAVGMVQLDAHSGQYLDANQRYCEITGYSMHELRHMTPVDLDYPLDREHDQDLLRKLLAGEIPEYFNVKRYVRKTGEIIWVQINGSLIRNAAGQPIRTIAVVHDVTAVQQTQAELKHSLAREQQRAQQLRGLSEAAMAISEGQQIDEILQDVTERARGLIGAHQAVTSFTTNLNWAQAISGLSLSDKYAEFRTYDPLPDGSGIYAIVCETNQPKRMTQAALEAHPRWRGFGKESARHPPMRGWLAAPLVGQDGRNLGLMQLSDKYDGEFTAEDEAILVQLARMTSTALEIRMAQDLLEQRIEERTQELATANAELKRAQAELAEVASRLALPERADELQDRNYRLPEFSLCDMMDCGAAIRGLSSRPSMWHFADAMVRYFYNRFVDAEGKPALALARLFETRRFDQLTPVQTEAALAAAPDIAPDTCCLTLVATAGDEDDWNDIRKSQGHQAIPLPSAEAIQQLPMVAQLIRQFGMEVSGVLQPDPEILISGCETGVFHIEEAEGSPYIPAQQQFVIPHGIQSVIGFGDLLPDGRLFAVILFSKVSISRETAVLIGHLSQSARLALLAYADVPNRTQSQIVSLDRLLRNHERIVADQEDRLQQTMLRLAASNAELEQFAYVASHDLQEPLRKIQAFGNLLVSGYRDQLGEEGQDYLQRMHRAAERMQTLINDLLTLSRVLRKGQPFQAVNLNDIVQSVLVDLEARISGTQGRVDVGDLPVVFADPTQMRQLLQNLIGNALKYRRPEEPPVVTVAARHCADTTGTGLPQWEISVTDNGIGFDQQYAERIFQPFQRLHGRNEYEGTGMGLTICRRIVDRHHGSIAAEGMPGRGARFIVRLPDQEVPEDSSDAVSR